MERNDDFDQYQQAEEAAFDELFDEYCKQEQVKDERQQEEKERQRKIDDERREQQKRQQKIDDEIRQEQVKKSQENERRAKEKEEELERQKEEKNQKNIYHRSVEKINQDAIQLSDSAHEWALASEEMESIKDKLLALRKQNQRFSSAGTFLSISYLTIVFTILVVIGINYFLINAPVSFMASLVFGNFYDWRVQVATVILPIGLMGIEIYISDQIYWEKQKLNLAIRRNREKREALKARQGNNIDLSKFNPKLKVWRVVGYFMIAFTPLMILGTTMVREDWLEPENLLIHLGLMILAAVTDASIIFGGDLITPAKAFIGFKIQERILLPSLRSAKSKYRLAERNIEKYCNLYLKAITSHQKSYPNDTDIQWNFSEDVISIVNQCLGKKL